MRFHPPRPVKEDAMQSPQALTPPLRRRIAADLMAGAGVVSGLFLPACSDGPTGPHAGTRKVIPSGERCAMFGYRLVRSGEQSGVSGSQILQLATDEMRGNCRRLDSTECERRRRS